MSEAQLKASLHTLIETCEDAGLLEGLYKILNAAQKQEEKDWWDKLDEEDKQKLEESIKQYGQGKYITHEAALQKAKGWLKK